MNQFNIRHFLTVFFVLLAGLTIANAQQPEQQSSQQQMPANGVTQAAIKSGVQTCAARINQVTNFVGAGSQVGSMLFVTPSNQDKQLISISMEVAAKTQTDGKKVPVAYSTASFAPNQANGCGAVYDAIIYWDAKCDTVATKRFGDRKMARALQKNITILEGKTPAKVFLMPAGNGCISIKKEVVL